MADENYKKKAVEVLIESLKLYFTFSTVLIAGSLTYFSKLTDPLNLWALYIELLAFMLCALCSILNINFFINDIHKNEKYNARNTWSIVPNIIAIVAFLTGLGFGIYFFVSNNHDTAVKPVTQDTVTIEKGKITIPALIQAKVQVVIDSIHKTQTVHINDTIK